MPDEVSAQLNWTMTNWMSNPKKGFALNRKQKAVELSAIFDFFPPDFKPVSCLHVFFFFRNNVCFLSRMH